MKLPRRKRIKMSVRKKIFGTSDKPRLSVFRSSRAIYAQVIDDNKGVTLASSSSTSLNKKKNLSIAVSKRVGQDVASKLLALGLSSVVFDRNGRMYHGNIEALAEGAREAGLKF